MRNYSTVIHLKKTFGDCVCVCVCVSERERERERYSVCCVLNTACQKQLLFQVSKYLLFIKTNFLNFLIFRARKKAETERERERERDIYLLGHICVYPLVDSCIVPTLPATLAYGDDALPRVMKATSFDVTS